MASVQGLKNICWKDSYTNATALQVEAVEVFKARPPTDESGGIMGERAAQVIMLAFVALFLQLVEK